MRKIGMKNKSWENVHTFSFQEGRIATEIATAIRLMTATAQEWRGELGIIARSIDVKPALDNVSPESLSPAMKEMDIAPMLAGAIMREEIGGRYDITPASGAQDAVADLCDVRHHSGNSRVTKKGGCRSLPIQAVPCELQGVKSREECERLQQFEAEMLSMSLVLCLMTQIS